MRDNSSEDRILVELGDVAEETKGGVFGIEDSALTQQLDMGLTED